MLSRLDNSMRVAGHVTAIWTSYSHIARLHGVELNHATSPSPCGALLLRGESNANVAPVSIRYEQKIRGIRPTSSEQNQSEKSLSRLQGRHRLPTYYRRPVNGKN